jgi:hypothetical protein
VRIANVLLQRLDVDAFQRRQRLVSIVFVAYALTNTTAQNSVCVG